MRRPSILLVSYVLAGLVLGKLLSSLPAPATVTTFWLGNLSSPWVVVAFLAGWSQRSRIRAAMSELAAEVACVAGFDVKLLFVDPDHLGLPRSTGTMTLIATGVVQRLSFIGPWAAVAIAAGGAYGLLLRGASDVGFGQGSLVLWLAEAGVGIAILAWVFAANGPLRHARVVIGPGVVIRIPHGHQAGPHRSSRSLHARR